jgi:hypothetical protein
VLPLKGNNLSHRWDYVRQVFPKCENENQLPAEVNEVNRFKNRFTSYRVFPRQLA